MFSIPESEREKRHQLRSRLSWLGFGTVASGVWIAPDHIELEARDALKRSGLEGYVDLFRAEYVAFRPEREQVASWWDLAELERMYEEFVATYWPMLERWRCRRKPDNVRAFTDYVNVLTHWRRLPYLHPGLKPELLPQNWCGTRAADLFFEFNERLVAAAHRYVETVVDLQSDKTA